MDNIYDILNQFMTQYDLYPHDIPGFPGYQCDRMGTIYNPDGSIKEPYNSGGYNNVYIPDANGKKTVKGVHQLVAMTFKEEYYTGCVVHHKDENKKHNWDENLQIESNEEHSRHHANPQAMLNWQKEHGGPANKGQKMSDEFRDHCREGALRRAERERTEGTSGRYANQFVDVDGNKKEMDPAKYEEFCEKCRQSALNRTDGKNHKFYGNQYTRDKK